MSTGVGCWAPWGSECQSIAIAQAAIWDWVLGAWVRAVWKRRDKKRDAKNSLQYVLYPPTFLPSDHVTFPIYIVSGCLVLAVRLHTSRFDSLFWLSCGLVFRQGVWRLAREVCVCLCWRRWCCSPTFMTRCCGAVALSRSVDGEGWVPGDEAWDPRRVGLGWVVESGGLEVRVPGDHG